MGTQVTSAVWEQSMAEGTERLVLLAIADEASNETYEAWPSVSHLARRCRISERTVQRAITTLRDRGELMVQERSGRRHVNVYKVRIDDPRQFVTGDNLSSKGDSGVVSDDAERVVSVEADVVSSHVTGDNLSSTHDNGVVSANVTGDNLSPQPVSNCHPNQKPLNQKPLSLSPTVVSVTRQRLPSASEREIDEIAKRIRALRPASPVAYLRRIPDGDLDSILEDVRSSAATTPDHRPERRPIRQSIAESAQQAERHDDWDRRDEPAQQPTLPVDVLERSRLGIEACRTALASATEHRQDDDGEPSWVKARHITVVDDDSETYDSVDSGEGEAFEVPF